MARAELIRFPDIDQDSSGGGAVLFQAFIDVSE
jgi:hypothetical protein